MKKVVVTGGLGFIGYELIKQLNVEELYIFENFVEPTEKVAMKMERYQSFLHGLTPNDPRVMLMGFKNMMTLPDDFWKNIDMVFHLGAISNTRHKHWESLQQLNIDFTTNLLYKCSQFGVPVVNSSSASVYGNTNEKCVEGITNEHPLNLYALTKKTVDDFILHEDLDNSVASLRFFNVFSLYKKSTLTEEHKYLEDQCSPHYRWSRDILKDGHRHVKLFEGSDEIYRDFIFIDDVIDYIKKFARQLVKTPTRDVFNIGKGRPQSFASVVSLISNYVGHDITVRTIPFPEDLKDTYQYYTCADMSKTDLFLEST